MSRKRVLREFRIDEISGVDRPAQEGAHVAIMKRADPEDGADDRMLKCVTAAIAMTGEAEDHQHGIGLDSEGNYSGLYVGYGYLTDGTEHFHPITRSPLAIGMSAGHTHDVDAAAIASVVMEKGDVDMAEQTTKQDEQPTMEAIQAQLARASAVIALSNEERAHFDALPEEARTAFLSKSAAERKGEIVAVTKAAQDAGPGRVHHCRRCGTS